MRLAPLILAASFASAQNITFSAQGAEFLRAQLGSVIPGEQALGVIACSAGAVGAIEGGAIYQQALAQGYSYILPAAVPSITTRRVNMSKSARAVQWLKYGSILGATLASGAVVHVPANVTTALIMGHGLVDDIQPYFASKIPDPSVLLSGLIDPTKQYALPVGGCIQGYIVAQYTGRSRPAPPPQIMPTLPTRLWLPEFHGAAAQALSDAPGFIPRLWTVDTERPEETGLAAMKGNAGQWHNGVEVASR